MSHLVLFVLGAPGVGKTTLVRELLGPYVNLIDKPKWTIGHGAIAAGHYTGHTFDGGDTVPYSGARACLEYWRDSLLGGLREGHMVTIFDGDRFSSKPSLDFIRATGERVVGVHLVAGEIITAARRMQRGSNQNEAWLKGRVTKADNFAKLVDATRVDASAPVDIVARHVLASLRAARAQAVAS